MSNKEPELTNFEQSVALMTLAITQLAQDRDLNEFCMVVGGAIHALKETFPIRCEVGIAFVPVKDDSEEPRDDVSAFVSATNISLKQLADAITRAANDPKVETHKLRTSYPMQNTEVP